MSDCLFCKIIAGEIPCSKAYEDEDCIAFSDINPQAPTHILIVPKLHVKDIGECAEKDAGLTGRLFKIAARVARERGLSGGYRLITNSGPDARQSVMHFHIHLLGGVKMNDSMV